MRTFISIQIPEEIKKKIIEIQLPDFVGKKIEKENLHLTLKFLGEVSKEQIETIKERLRKIHLKKFAAKITEAGVFNENFIKIIWLNIENCEGLQKEIDEVLFGLFEKEKRFMGHLTIARVKFCEDRKKVIEEIRKIKTSEEFNVESFELMKSDLKREGPVYEILEKYNLE
ncbi:MAG: RNA 2',3'-cyclic phosphodiesterase [Nanoarchaeota archaeon]|nr:RNA 2',3'-cyclic phosphodiesterase [Nanoarchaeota archaeon]